MGTAIGSVICLLSLLTHAVSPDVGLAVACALPGTGGRFSGQRGKTKRTRQRGQDKGDKTKG
eukprot:362867-Chlamydomonas_euryale.AAC.3